MTLLKSFNEYPPLVFSNASSYFQKIQEEFGDQKQVYYAFLRLIDHYNTGKLTSGQVFVHINVLFKGHDKLILGFNALFPPGYYVGAVRHQPSRKITMNHAPGASSTRLVKTSSDFPISPPVSPTKPRKTESSSQYLKKKLGSKKERKGEKEIEPVLVIKSKSDSKRKINGNVDNRNGSVSSKRKKTESPQNPLTNKRVETAEGFQSSFTTKSVSKESSVSSAFPSSSKSTTTTSSSRLEQKPEAQGIEKASNNEKGPIRSDLTKKQNVSLPRQVLDVVDSSTHNKNSSVIFFIVEYIRRVKYHYKSEPEVYDKFIDLLNDYRRGKVLANEAFERVKMLLKRTPSLVKSFRRLLPEYSVQKAKEDRERRERAEVKRKAREEERARRKGQKQKRKPRASKAKLVKKPGQDTAGVDDTMMQCKGSGHRGQEDQSCGSLGESVAVKQEDGDADRERLEKRGSKNMESVVDGNVMSSSSHIRRNLSIASILN